MKLFISELQYVSELYSRLRKELIDQTPMAAGVTALTETVLRNRELLARVEQMNVRLFQLSNDWQTFRAHLDPQCRTEIQALAHTVKVQASELAQLLEQQLKTLKEGRGRLEKTLEETRQGARYLASVNPVKTNYPKFLDSHG
jgi:hypothetical protein